MKSVVITGRPNVGKSSLFNLLVNRRSSIVHHEAGVTRDPIVGYCTRGNSVFEIIDTGGICEDTASPFFDVIQEKAHEKIGYADLVLFIVDGKVGVTVADQELALFLRKIDKRIILLVNKIDHQKHSELVSEFFQLGFHEMISISTAHGKGILELLEKIDSYAEQSADDPLKNVYSEESSDDPLNNVSTDSPRLSIVGRTNVGKSSIFNKILGYNSTIVSDIAGTTRDAVEIPCEWNGKKYKLVDTAGLRHRSCRDNAVEIFSAMRTEQALRRSDISFLVIDLSVGITAQDKAIAGLIYRFKKASVILLNKCDLMNHKNTSQIIKQEEMVRAELHFLNYAPLIAISAKTGFGVQKIFPLCETIYLNSRTVMTTGELNRLLQKFFEEHQPPSQGGKRLKLFYATHVSSEKKYPFHAIELILFVNNTKLITDSYKNYLIRKIRNRWPFLGLPILIQLRNRNDKEKKNLLD